MNAQSSLRVGQRPAHFLGAHDVVTVGLFFRGPWCPVCRRQLIRIGERQVEWDSLGAKIIAVSSCPVTDSPEDAPLLQHGIDFRHDPGGLEIERLGLTHEHPDHGIIARPATLIADTNGIIRFAHIGSHTRDRPEPEAILLGVQSLAKHPTMAR